MPHFKSRHGLDIYYEVHGEAGSPLILLHGLASNTRLWTPQLTDFRPYHRTIVFDYPGHGRSSHTKQYSIIQYAEVLADLMDHLAITKAHLAGLSLGCAVGLDFACRYPDRVASLILEGPVGGLKPKWHPASIIKMLALTLYLSCLFISWKTVGQGKTAHLINKYGAQTYGYYFLLESVEREVDPMAVGQMTLQLAYPSYIGKLSRLRCPVLVLRGKDDPVPKRYVKYILNHVPGPCDLISIPGARHVVALEKPAEFNRHALAFLKRNDFAEPTALQREKLSV